MRSLSLRVDVLYRTLTSYTPDYTKLYTLYLDEKAVQTYRFRKDSGECALPLYQIYLATNRLFRLGSTCIRRI